MEVKKMKKWIVGLVGLLIIFFMGTIAQADEISELKKQLAELQKRIEELESKQKAQDKAMEEKITKAVEEKQVDTLPDSIKWVENVKISGDLRYRHETIDKQSSGQWQQSTNRHRIRARVKVEGKVNDEADVTVRIASGNSSDPVSTNQDLEDSFDSKDIWLDQAYFDWHPDSMSGFSFFGGKMANPFYKVGKNQLIWDNDLNPEGLALQYQNPLSENCTLFANGGGFWVDEGSVDTSLWGAQAYLKHKMQNKGSLLGGLSFYDYANLEGTPSLNSRWGGTASDPFFGNSNDGTNFTNDYAILEGFGEYTFFCAMNEMPFSVFGNYVKNTNAVSGADKGWLAGFKVNKAKAPGSWEASYNYRDLEADAVVGQFNDSDFRGGGTKGRGHKLGFKYQISKHLQTGVTYYVTQKADAYDNKYNRLMTDLVFNF